MSILDDEFDGDHSPGDLSLREAISLANDNNEADSILLSAGNYRLTLTGTESQTPRIEINDLDIESELQILGTSASEVTIDASGIDRAITNFGQLTLSDLTITGGFTLASGGGVLSHDELQLTRVVIEGNQASIGGGVASVGPLVRVEESWIHDNLADFGGGLAATEQAGAAADVRIEASTISDNRAFGSGGGIMLNVADAALTASTVSANKAGRHGGGVWLQSVAASSAFELVSSTIVGNDASGNGGGVAVGASDGLSAAVHHTIVATNSAGTGEQDIDPGGAGFTFQSQGSNLVSQADASIGFADGVSGDQVGSTGAALDPLLTPLFNHGGSTPTHLPRLGSPVIDAGTLLSTIEQRGLPRRADGNGDGSNVADIGAVELQRNTMISGVKFHDHDRSGAQDAGEEGVAGFVIFADTNANGQADAGEPTTITGSDGSYWLMELPPGTHSIGEIVQANWEQTAPLANADGFTFRAAARVPNSSVPEGESFGVSTLDTDSVTETYLADQDFLHAGLDQDPITGTLYAAGTGLRTIDPTTGEILTNQPILDDTTNQNVDMRSIAIDPSGQMYGLSVQLFADPPPPPDLYRIDKATGTATKVGTVNVTEDDPVLGMDFGPDGTLYASALSLKTIDTTTGQILTTSDPYPIEFFPDFSFRPRATADIDFAADGFIYGVDGVDVDDPIFGRFPPIPRLFKIDTSGTIVDTIGEFDSIGFFGLASVAENSGTAGFHSVTLVEGQAVADIDFGNIRTAVEVVGRHLFYNDSAFDGNDVAANPFDDRAIAFDKQALLPGQTASFRNYTGYSAGVNGVMVDIAGVADANALSLNDFEFREGNDNTPDSWATASPPTEVATRTVSGVTRITFTWDRGTLVDRWLQVRVRANSTTGLSADDVFYFGNAVGETGNSTSNAIVNGNDFVATRGNPHSLLSPALLSDRYDFNRDRQVNVSDLGQVRDHATTLSTALRLISPPAIVGKSAGIVRSSKIGVFEIDGLRIDRRGTNDTAKREPRKAIVIDMESLARGSLTLAELPARINRASVDSVVALSWQESIRFEIDSDLEAAIAALLAST